MTDRMKDEENSENTLAGAVSAGSTLSSKDSLLGKGIAASVILGGITIAVFFGFLGYRLSVSWQDDRESIGTLSVVEPTSQNPETVVQETNSDEEADQAAIEVDKASVEIIVLNGGAPAGTAGKVVKSLVDEGFSKAEAGNADGTHVGVVIYYDGDSEAATALVKEALSGTYADAKIAPADPKKKDTFVAPVTVVIAK